MRIAVLIMYIVPCGGQDDNCVNYGVSCEQMQDLTANVDCQALHFESIILLSGCSQTVFVQRREDSYTGGMHPIYPHTLNSIALIADGKC